MTLPLFAQQEPDRLEIERLDSIRLQLDLQKQYDESIKYAVKVHSLAQKLEPTDTLYIKSIIALGGLYYEFRQETKAIKYLTEAEQLLTSDNNTDYTFLAEVYLYLSLIYTDRNDYPLSVSYVHKILDILEKNSQKESVHYAITLTELGLMYSKMDQHNDALEQYQKSKNILLKLFPDKKHKSYIDLLTKMGMLHDYSLQKYNKAEDYYLEAIQLSKQLDEYPAVNYAYHLTTLAGLYHFTGAYEKAILLYQEAQKIYVEELEETDPFYVNCLLYMGALYSDMERYSEAEMLYKKVLFIDSLTIGTNNTDYAISLYNLGSLYAKQKRYSEAIHYYKRACTIHKNKVGTNNLDYCVYLKKLSEIYISLEQYQKAEQLLTEALAIEEGYRDQEPFSYANTLCTIGQLKAKQQLLEESLDYYGQSLALYLAIPTPLDWNNLPTLLLQPSQYDDPIMEILTHIALAYQAKYQQTNDLIWLRKEQEIYLSILQINDRVQKEFDNEQDKYHALEATSVVVERVLETATKLYVTTPTEQQQRNNDLLGYTERNKSILLAQTIDQQKRSKLGHIPDSLQLIEQQLQEEAIQLKAMLAAAKTKESRTEINSLQNKWAIKNRAFEKKLSTEYPKYVQLQYTHSSLSVDSLQKKLPPHTLLLTYFVGQRNIYALGITSTDCTFRQIAVEKPLLKSHLATFRNALSNYQFILKSPKKSYKQYTQEAHWFYQKLVAPFLTIPDLKNLIIVPDAELGNIPFEVVLTTAASQQQVDYSELDYLLKQYNISYNYSASLWLQNQQKGLKANNNKLLAYAAQYDGDTTNLRAIRSPQWVNMRERLPALPATQEEVQELTHHYSGDSYLGNQANEAHFKKTVPSYNIIHLAMHGIINAENPILSSLVFTEDRDTTEDNFLQVDEIYQLDLAANLVVLSACETGYGKFQQGEGILSLARSFMYAGTPSLVVSLWQVNDRSTAIIMTDFYANLAEGLPKDEALRLAKLSYLDKSIGKAQHPAFWSAFVQLGDNRPIALPRKFNWLLWGGIGSALVLLLSGGLWFLRSKKS